ncbi:GNAT family N-acetyltransferase [Croceimicrobium hydrocarbonivorans]|uniref:GNAT family N-acetyltransferase n=1 Tax=Croceimicrobium hydrocarbonivorans TaxID=2761580 RepID=A0A7H0VDW5_9FLAO|nr:GNAT family N-acetyltransferase [Croceimicrobium hydrocarbonivorans]QNR23913.1 GNAT family N-acetyltransferase [Croceimicrobium hydrocarbonivorans]
MFCAPEISHLEFTKRAEDQVIPYDLLLLADESIPAINSYIHFCEIYRIKISAEIIGVCAIQRLDSKSLEIKNLALIEAYRNSGIGAWCIQQLEAHFSSQFLFVATGDASFAALRFYERNGFKRSSIRRNFFLDNYEQAIFENGIQLKDQILLRKRVS